MLSFCVSAISSNEGKTILTTALLHHFKKSVRPFKIGPDYIDPQFHKMVCETDSINLDSFIMDEKQVKWLYNNYSDKDVSILEGVMGFYDGDDKGCSAYSITKLLNISTILLLDASGSYITISAVLKGLLTYKNDNTIKAIVLNNISSNGHFELIKSIIQKDYPNIVILGWIEKNIQSLNNTHLGLDLKNLNKIEDISKDVLKHIDIDKLEHFAKTSKVENKTYPFQKIEKNNKKIAVVNDENFSFLYYDNLEFLKEIFQELVIVDATKDEEIPEDAHSVYICGGYVETDDAYNKIKDSKKFKNSLIKHSKSKKIYAECAGLLYLGNRVDDKEMSKILDVDFTLDKKFNRLGYYYNSSGIKGHSFHYTRVIDDSKGFEELSKGKNSKGKIGSFKDKDVFGTYLHTMFRNNLSLIKDRF